MKDLLKKVLDFYFERYKNTFGSFPKAVRYKGMDIPHFDVEYGNFGQWHPEEAHFCIPKEELDDIFGVTIHDELYEYYRYWRFASLELEIDNFRCMMNPIFETMPDRTNFFFSLLLDGEMYFKLGIAEKIDGYGTYAIIFRNKNGVYLLEDGTENPVFLCESIYRFFEESGV